MKIAVKVTVEMTLEQVAQYCEIAGISRDEIRDDVRSYVRTALQDSPELGPGAADVMVAD